MWSNTLFFIKLLINTLLCSTTESHCIILIAVGLTVDNLSTRLLPQPVDSHPTNNGSGLCEINLSRSESHKADSYFTRPMTNSRISNQENSNMTKLNNPMAKEMDNN